MGRKKPTVRDEESGPAAGGAGGKSKKKAFVIADDEYSVGTELSEEAVVPEEKVAAGGNRRKVKKGFSKKVELKDDDDDNEVVREEVEEEEVKFAGKKNGKGKKSGSSVLSGSNFGLLGEDEEEDADESKDNDEDDEELSEPEIAFSGRKKPGKNGKGGANFSSAFDLLDEEEENEDNDEISREEEEEEEEEEEKVAFSGKKKPSKNKKGGVSFTSAFDLLDSDEENKDENSIDEDEVAFSGRKKPSKNKKSGGNFSSAFDILDGEEDKGVNESSKEEEEFVFSGKKKPSKNKKSSAKFSSAFESLDGEEENKEESAKEEDEVGISFTGKKKKKSSKGLKKATENSVLDEENDEDIRGGGGDQEEDVPAIKFSGKKKPSKKKNMSVDSAVEEVGEDVTSSVVTKLDQHDDESKTQKQTTEDGIGNSKNKKKKKKGGKTGQEEDDIDQILAELHAAPNVSKQVPAPVATPAIPPLEKPQNQSELDVAAGDKEAEEGPAETAASKKKKKKKDKEKEKKAAVSEEKQEEPKNDASSKISGKKVPKHVKEMQERLAKLKEAEEKKRREEEERLRKEEEERRQQEELERLAEEKRRLKKEREKEKLLKKKQEGKLLTGKQKEEARRLEAMRKQILANAAALQLPPGEAAQAPAKKPIYQKKKSKAQPQSNGAATLDSAESTVSNESRPDTPSELDVGKAEDVAEAKNIDEVDSLSAQDQSEVTEENVVEEEEDDDEDWDAKSWDDADLKLPGKSDFDDEEADSGSETLRNKEIKNSQTSTKNADVPSLSTKPSGGVEKGDSRMPHKPENVKKTSEAEIVDQRNKKDVQVKEETKKTDDSSNKSEQNLRSPICCIMGHVDAGKTKLLDCIRRTNVQEGEAGGITQQIGATYFPAENIRERTKELKADAKLNVPGLLVIDTPGHESFTNLRSRGSGLCDIAILVVDIFSGLEPQTIESLNLLKMRNTEFIVALNKVDRLYGWKTCRNAPIVKAMKQQSKDVILEFNMRLTQVITQFKEQGLNTELYYKNKEMGETFSIVPTSAISGEGIPDLLLLLVQWAQKTMVERLTFSDKVQCTVLEVKVVEGHGTTIDVVLVNGVLHEGDQIVVCGLQGPIVTSIRALLTPHPMKELRVKGTYMHHKEIKAAQGIKITAQGLEHAIAGTSLHVVRSNDDLEEIKDAAMEDMNSVMNRIDKSGEGVYVQASTLGSLEALLEFLKTPEVNIPVSGISIGPVHKKDIMKASVMLEKKREYATILAFDVKVTQESRELAEELGVKIFIADIIYHLFDQFKAYIKNLKDEKKKEAADEAVFPCVLKIMPNCVFNKKDPIVLGVDVLEGIAKIGTPICVPQRDFIELGRIASIENNYKPVDFAKKGHKVAIKIIGNNPDEQQKMFGRHFEMEDELVSKISRNSLDALKEYYAEDLTADDKRLLFKLKRLFKIP